jgi:hypothetical protein
MQPAARRLIGRRLMTRKALFSTAVITASI